MNELPANRWLEFVIAEQRYAMRVDGILELVDPTGRTITTPPGMPPSFRGVMDLRSSLVPILDLRLEMGLPTMQDETRAVIEMLKQREQDHVNWINELDSSVRQEREFKLATDPHKCAFGKWYDHMMTCEEEQHKFTNGNLALRLALRGFDEPHKRIHALAIEVGDLVASHQIEKALTLIEDTRETTLSAMIKLFEQTRSLVQGLRKSLVIVLEHGDELLGIIVDGVHTVREIEQQDVCPAPPETDQTGFVLGIATIKDASNGDQLIQLLDASGLFQKHADSVVKPEGADSSRAASV